MENFLDRMARLSRERAQAAREREPLAAISRRAAAAPEPLTLTLSGFDLIAELKLRSPAAGGLADDRFDAAGQLDAYVAGGAAAVSVLTEPAEFNGRLEHLADAATRLRPLGCPVLRKDFLVDRYQLFEARANGASGVLLIAAMLDDTELPELVATAQELGLFVVLEAFDGDDLERIATLGIDPARSQVLVGVNSRNLRTLAVDIDRFARLAGRLRRDVPAVAESGIETRADIEAVARLGYSLALVGSALMRDRNSAARVTELIAAGRAALGDRAACS
jgi:indole-3-glycerol phosphate synthase